MSNTNDVFIQLTTLEESDVTKKPHRVLLSVKSLVAVEERRFQKVISDDEIAWVSATSVTFVNGEVDVAETYDEVKQIIQNAVELQGNAL